MHVLVVLGSSVLILLGIVHGIYTLRSSPRGGPMTPRDPQVRAAMEIEGGLGLAPELEITLWQSWVGFNLSHSLGAVAVGLFIGVPALLDFQSALDDGWWIVLALGLPAAYLVLSIRYWFDKPTVGLILSLALIWTGVIAELVT